MPKASFGLTKNIHFPFSYKTVFYRTKWFVLSWILWTRFSLLFQVHCQSQSKYWLIIMVKWNQVELPMWDSPLQQANKPTDVQMLKTWLSRTWVVKLCHLSNFVIPFKQGWHEKFLCCIVYLFYVVYKIIEGFHTFHVLFLVLVSSLYPPSVDVCLWLLWTHVRYSYTAFSKYTRNILPENISWNYLQYIISLYLFAMDQNI